MSRLLTSLVMTLAFAGAASAQPALPYRLSDLLEGLAAEVPPGQIESVVAGLVGGVGVTDEPAFPIPEGQRERLFAAMAVALRTGEAPGLLDRMPALNMRELELAAQAAVKRAQAEAARERAAGAEGAQAGVGQAQDPAGAQQGGSTAALRDVLREPLGLPTGAPPRTDPEDREVGMGVVRGGRVHPELGARFGDSSRLADVLNRLALNPSAASQAAYLSEYQGEAFHRPEALVRALQAAGHTVEMRDARYFADFAGLKHGERDVAAPFWLDTEIPVPGTKRTLAVPATHSQHELIVRGPQVNADLKFFFGIEGEAKFRPMWAQRPEWSGSRIARSYRGDEAIEALRVASEVRRAFEAKKAAHPDLPWGGYFNVGVCNDSNAIIEQAMTGATTLYPLTANKRFWTGRSEIDRLAQALPQDLHGEPADIDRVLASIAAEEIDELVFPGLREDLLLVAGEELPPQGVEGMDGVLEEGLGQQQEGVTYPRGGEAGGKRDPEVTDPAEQQQAEQGLPPGR